MLKRRSMTSKVNIERIPKFPTDSFVLSHSDAVEIKITEKPIKLKQ